MNRYSCIMTHIVSPDPRQYIALRNKWRERWGSAADSWRWTGPACRPGQTDENG